MLFILLLFCFNLVSCHELDLRNKLFKNYNKNIRPVINYNDNINLNISIDIKNLEFFNQVSETISINLWITMTWKDEYLKWNYSKFNINILKLSSHDVWLPDLVLYNSAKKIIPYNVLDQMIVNNEGFVKLIRPATYTFSCPLSLQKFPFDKQNCIIEFGSWQFNKQYLNIKYDNKINSTIDNFIKHNEWNLYNIEYSNLELEYLCCPNELWSVLQYNLQFERYKTSYNAFIIMTILLTTSSCIISLFNLKLYNRVYVLIFIPLTIIWLLQSIIKRIPVIGYFTIMDKLLLSSFIVCELLTIESGFLYNIYINNKLFYNKIKINNKTQRKTNKKFKKYNILKKYNYDTNYNKLLKLLFRLELSDSIIRICILLIYYIYIIYNLN
jgi:hypothetical protein